MYKFEFSFFIYKLWIFYYGHFYSFSTFTRTYHEKVTIPDAASTLSQTDGIEPIGRWPNLKDWWKKTEFIKIKKTENYIIYKQIRRVIVNDNNESTFKPENMFSIH